MEWKITGPFENIEKFKSYKNTNIIILGDTDFSGKNKKMIKKLPDNDYYCVRGAFDKDPVYTENLIAAYDEKIKGVVYYDLKTPNIRYFADGEIYELNNKKVLVLGGGIAKDENYNLLKNGKWSSSSVISKSKRDEISLYIKNKKVDMVLSYCAPYSWNGQDGETERWLDQIKNTFSWNKWYFGKPKTDEKLWEGVACIHNRFIDLIDE